jgi:hypothetical protein
MKFYISARPLIFDNRMHFPHKLISEVLVGLDVTIDLVCFDHNKDGRILYLVSSSEDSEVKEVILEAFSGYAGHEKTLNSAKVLAEKITEIVWEIDLSTNEIKGVLPETRPTF